MRLATPGAVREDDLSAQHHISSILVLADVSIFKNCSKRIRYFKSSESFHQL
jgi:hypothetical protein